MESISAEIDNLSKTIQQIKDVLQTGFVIGCFLDYDGVILTVGDGIYYYRGVKHYVSETSAKMAVSEGNYIMIDEDRNVIASGYGDGLVLGRYDGENFDYSMRSKLIPEDITRSPKNMIDSMCSFVTTAAELPQDPETMFYYVMNEKAFYVYYKGWNRVGYNSILPVEVTLS